MSTMCPDVLADDQPPLAEPPKPIDGPEAKNPSRQTSLLLR